MAETYAQLLDDIELLKLRAEAARKKKGSLSVISRIKSAITAYGLTAAELELSSGDGHAACRRTESLRLRTQKLRLKVRTIRAWRSVQS